jgi:hypothetical protein
LRIKSATFDEIDDKDELYEFLFEPWLIITLLNKFYWGFEVKILAI